MVDTHAVIVMLTTTMDTNLANTKFFSKSTEPTHRMITTMEEALMSNLEEEINLTAKTGEVKAT